MANMLDKNIVYTLNTDGGSRGNPGNAATGVIIHDSNLDVVFEEGKYIGVATNNVAEYKALVRGLEVAVGLGISNLEVYMDSELIIKQMRGEYKVKDAILFGFFTTARELVSRFEKVSFIHVKREFNKDADRLVNKALDFL